MNEKNSIIEMLKKAKYDEIHIQALLSMLEMDNNYQMSVISEITNKIINARKRNNIIKSLSEITGLSIECIKNL